MSISRNVKAQIAGMVKSKKSQRMLIEKAEELKSEGLNDESILDRLKRECTDSTLTTKRDLEE
jgi:hypothetical protein